MKPGIVLDTNVLVAGSRSRRGAAFQLLSLVGTARFDIHLSVPLLLEYEQAFRHRRGSGLSREDVDDMLDYLCAVSVQHDVFFLWRPKLRDPKDEMVLEAAVVGRCSFIVSYNERDFAGAEEFDLTVRTPAAFLEEIGEVS